MQLAGLTASAAPSGGRIVLSWRNPDPASSPGVRVVRRRGAHPTTATPASNAAGVVVADSELGGPADVEALADGRLRVVDRGLAEGMHYYLVAPFAGDPRTYDLDPGNRIAAAATAPYGFGDQLARLLPALYHRFDTATPSTTFDAAVVAAMAQEDRDRGQLRRFLELPGSQLDQLYSDIGSLLDLHDVERVDGALLPLLAEAIGWSTDHRLGYDQQRAEIRSAPALYAAVGTVPAIEATVRRIAGWSSRTKEFVDNVFLTSQPERRTLWLASRDADAWVLPDAPLSSDDAPHGRAVAARESAGSLRLVYHTRRSGRYEIRSKRHTTSGGWEPSEPVVARAGVDRDPAAVQQGGTTWVFWTAYDPDAGTWRIDWRTSQQAGWGPVSAFRSGPGDATDRRQPAAAVDDDGALWLFWLEDVAGWRLRYARFDGDPWNPTPDAAVDFPDDAGSDPRVEADLLVLSRPPQAGDPDPEFRRIGVLWARREPVTGSPEQTRWRSVARFKDGLEPGVTGDWGPVVALPMADEERSDREPAAFVAADGSVTAFVSSTRDGGWSLHEAQLDLDPVGWSTPTPVSGLPFSERAPLPLALATAGDLDALCFRSNRSLSYRSSTYQATTTVDRRYSGSTTVRTSDVAKLALRGTYDDFGAYTYDTGRGDDDWYARDTVGLYVRPGTADAVDLRRERLRRVLPEFSPATDRTLVITPPD